MRGFTPEDARDARVVRDETVEVPMRDHAHLGRREGREAVIHRLEEQALQVRDLPGDMEGQDLPPVAAGELVAEQEALDQKAAMGWRVAFLDDVLIRPEFTRHDRKTRQRLPLLRCEIDDRFQFADQRVRACRAHDIAWPIKGQ